jgi:hypothetical protein
MLKIKKTLKFSVSKFQFFAISPISLGFGVKLDDQMVKLPLYPCKLYEITKLQLIFKKEKYRSTLGKALDRHIPRSATIEMPGDEATRKMQRQLIMGVHQKASRIDLLEKDTRPSVL